jgi:hypothetical protein
MVREMNEAAKLLGLAISSGIILWVCMITPALVAGLIDNYRNRSTIAGYFYNLFWKYEHKVTDTLGRMLAALAAILLLLCLFMIHLHNGVILIIPNFIFAMLLSGTAVTIFFYNERKAKEAP